MSLSTLIFWIFGALAAAFAAATVALKNPVESAISMIFCLFSIAAVYFTMGAHFVGTIQILVYAGAIMVLFLFVLMLLEKRDAESFENLVTPPKVLNLFLVFLLLSSLTVTAAATFQGARNAAAPAGYGTIAAVGEAIFGKYIFAFEALSVLILVAIVGVTALSGKDGAKR